MNPKQIKELFEKHNEEHCNFERISKNDKVSQRPDLCAFMALDNLVPGKNDIILSSEHDEIWLNVDAEKLASKITEDFIIFLLRCGVTYDECIGFHMFV